MQAPANFRKKPVIIQALEWTGENVEAMLNFVGDDDMHFGMDDDGCITDLFIGTPEGIMKAEIGGYIIKGIKGEFYPCSREIFNATYDLVESDEVDESKDEISIAIPYSSWFVRAATNLTREQVFDFLTELEKKVGEKVVDPGHAETSNFFFANEWIAVSNRENVCAGASKLLDDMGVINDKLLSYPIQ